MRLLYVRKIWLLSFIVIFSTYANAQDVGTFKKLEIHSIQLLRSSDSKNWSESDEKLYHTFIFNNDNISVGISDSIWYDMSISEVTKSYEGNLTYYSFKRTDKKLNLDEECNICFVNDKPALAIIVFTYKSKTVYFKVIFDPDYKN